jgi:membrane dipeptidase
VYTVIDLHCDSVGFLLKGRDLRNPNEDGHVDLPRLRKGGVGAQVFSAFVSSGTAADKAFSAAALMLDRIDEFAASHPLLTQAVSAEDCEGAAAQGKTAILKAVENGYALEDSLKNLEALRRRNVRILTLVHAQDTSWAASCTGASQGGLKPFGESVVQGMNDLGMIIDVSHGSESLFRDTIRLSKKPVIASHSCAYSLCASPRNLKDYQLKTLADTGGLVGICFFPVFLNDPYRISTDKDMGGIFSEYEAIEKLAASDPEAARVSRKRLNSRIASFMEQNPVPLSLVVDHIDHIKKIAGVDSIALGSDFDGVFSLPLGMGGCDCYPALSEELERRGYSEEEIKKIFSGNFLRLLREHDK